MTQGKKIKGRKRHILVDTLGFILKVIVHRADIQDRDGARLLLHKCKSVLAGLKIIWADSGYSGLLVEWVKKMFTLKLEIVKRDPNQKGFHVLKRRWVVERTFSWLSKCRRLSKEYEVLPRNSESFIYLAMISLMAKRMSGFYVGSSHAKH